MQIPWLPSVLYHGFPVLKYSPVRQGDKGLDNLGDFWSAPHGIESQASHIHWLAETYPLVNYCNIDPENHKFLEETNLPTPTTTRVYVNLLEGSSFLSPVQPAIS